MVADPHEVDVVAAQAGDTAAFTRLHAAFSPMVHAIALSRLPPRDVHDVVQDTFLRAWQRLEQLREPARFGPWLAQIARRVAADAYRTAQPGAHVALDAHVDTLAAPAVPHAEAAHVLRHIHELPEAYRAPLLMRLVHGMSGAEIAAQTGLSTGSVRVNLHRGMAKLRAALDEGGPP